MKVRINIDRLVLHSDAMSRRERAALHEQIEREVNRLLDPRGSGPAPQARSGPRGSIADQIAAAINTQLSPQLPPRTGRHR
jgi:hypothetical protein